ncbi:hypothetical protein D8S78_01735 [Natrialba swarupiae]|nr:hypothetical protein [Natrialba swarupiae]
MYGPGPRHEYERRGVGRRVLRPYSGTESIRIHYASDGDGGSPPSSSAGVGVGVSRTTPLYT